MQHKFEELRACYLPLVIDVGRSREHSAVY